MRICVIIDAWEPIWGGGQTHVWQICIRLARDFNYEIDIFTRSFKAISGKQYSKSESYVNGRLRIFRVGPNGLFFRSPYRILWLFVVIKAVWQYHTMEPYAFIHAHAYSSGISAKILSKILHIPVVFTVHGSNNLDLRDNILLRWTENFLLTKIFYDQEISVSRFFVKYSNVNKNIAVIPNGVDIKLFNSIKKSKLSNKLFTILWVGRFDRVKGLPILVLAFVQALNTNPQLRLCLVGDGPEKENIKKICKTLRIESKVYFKNSKKKRNLVKQYKSAQLFILPSLSEGQPIVLLEAWAAKLPVVATRVGDNSLFVEEKVNGYLVSPGSVKELTRVILEALTNPYLSKLGENGYSLVLNNYTWDIITKKTVEVYEKLII